ncbi:ABC transporter permease [Xylanimonas ulmi]|uniref:ABC-2 type transport system permease protein n=1 Tax=Xylanimonas ulmi TaxID=228973 RepID=A0A4Q7M1G9_9MICO|nr:ABC transporter permease [Xylanibacterium ulmi]RZS61081.1 ABC-2 type transport system permease protein [Xylanibacterium ulmi]
MNLTYLRIDLQRQLRDVANIAFVIGLPVAMYLIFGTTFGAGDESAGHATVRFYVMASMAVYGASVATTAVAGMAAIELMQGWGRQIGLTPMRPAGYVATKVAVALIIAAGGVTAVFVVGALTGARADAAWIWVATFVIAWLGASLFALYGLAIAQTFRSESAVSVAAAGLVLLAFFGNLFVPLSGTILQVARFTPMYGYASLVRYPQLRGQVIDVGGGASQDPLWWSVANVVVWAVVFALVAVWAVRRGRARR